MAKSIAEINERIKKGNAVVVTAEEIIDIVEDKGVEKAAKEVDVVTTGTQGAMCSSGAVINLGHSDSRYGCRDHDQEQRLRRSGGERMRGNPLLRATPNYLCECREQPPIRQGGIQGQSIPLRSSHQLR